LPLIVAVTPSAAQERPTVSSEAADTSAVVIGAAERLSQPLRDVLLPVRELAPAGSASAAPAVLAPSAQSRAFMVAGAALFLAGIIAGGDAGAVLMLGGAGIGAYGVYLHFR